MRINQNPGFSTPDRLAVHIRNADTVTIPVGSPVVLVMNGTQDGLAVVLPTTAAAANLVQGLRYGVCTVTLPVNGYGEAVVFGLCNNLLLMRQTRSSSTVSWATEAARSIGEFLFILSAANGFQTGVSTTAITTGQTITIYVPDAVLGQTLASYAGSASSTADTRTALTASVKAFIRMM